MVTVVELGNYEYLLILLRVWNPTGVIMENNKYYRRERYALWGLLLLSITGLIFRGEIDQVIKPPIPEVTKDPTVQTMLIKQYGIAKKVTVCSVYKK